jgi:hypothetical protein
MRLAELSTEVGAHLVVGVVERGGSTLYLQRFILHSKGWLPNTAS